MNASAILAKTDRMCQNAVGVERQVYTTSDANRRSVFYILLLGHLYAGCFWAFWTKGPADYFSTSILVGLVFCQAGLVGAWAGLSSLRFTPRVVGLALGIVYLWLLQGWHLAELNGSFLLLVSLAAGSVAAATWLARLRWMRFQHIDRIDARVPEVEQFSIKNLLMLTLLVAIFFAVGRSAEFQKGPAVPVFRFTLILVLFAGISLGAVWAALGHHHPVAKSFLLLFLAAIGGYWLAYAIDSKGRLSSFWMRTALTQAGSLLASLAMVRIWGYRFVLDSLGSSRK